MPEQKEIANRFSDELISMTIYGPDHFTNFKPTNKFDKWAAVEVRDFSKVPAQMKTFVIPGGLYAVFNYKGLSTDNTIFQYIFQNWLPNSDYELDGQAPF